MGAEIALRRGMSLVVYIYGVVGAGLHTHLAANAPGVVKVDNAIVTDKEGLGWASGDARSIGAVVAPHDAHLTSRIGILTLFYIFDPGSKLTDGNGMFGLAGNGARVAADAGPLVNCESISHRSTSS